MLLFDKVTTKSKQHMPEPTLELSLKHSYPALQLFKNFVL